MATQKICNDINQKYTNSVFEFDASTTVSIQNLVSPAFPTFVGISKIKKGVSPLMNSTSLIVVDWDCTPGSLVLLVSNTSLPAWFIQVDPNVGSFTITSSAVENTTFTYYIIS